MGGQRTMPGLKGEEVGSRGNCWVGGSQTGWGWGSLHRQGGDTSDVGKPNAISGPQPRVVWGRASPSRHGPWAASFCPGAEPHAGLHSLRASSTCPEVTAQMAWVKITPVRALVQTKLHPQVATVSKLPALKGVSQLARPLVVVLPS